MYSVYSDAVARAISQGIKRQWTETRPYVTGSSASNITWRCLETYGGVKICFGRATSVRSASAVGNIFYSSGADEQWYYPTNMFSERPVCIMEVCGRTKWIIPGTQLQGGDKTKTKKICPHCAQIFGNETMYYDIMAFGV